MSKLTLVDESLKFAPSDINSSIKVSLFVRDKLRNEVTVRERYMDFQNETVVERKAKNASKRDLIQPGGKHHN